MCSTNEEIHPTFQTTSHGCQLVTVTCNIVVVSVPCQESLAADFVIILFVHYFDKIVGLFYTFNSKFSPNVVVAFSTNVKYMSPLLCELQFNDSKTLKTVAQ